MNPLQAHLRAESLNPDFALILLKAAHYLPESATLETLNQNQAIRCVRWLKQIGTK